MTRFNTGNPVPSADPRDRSDNSQAFDEAVNSEGTTFNDRLGKSRLTIKGMEQVFDGGQPAIDAFYRAVDAKRSAEDARDQAVAVNLEPEWYLQGNGVAMDVVFDASNVNGLVLDGSGNVDQVISLGRKSATLTPESATKSPAQLVSGYRSILFDGGVTYGAYSTTSLPWTETVFADSAVNCFIGVLTQSVVTTRQVPISVGVQGANSPRWDFDMGANGSTARISYNASLYGNTGVSREVGTTYTFGVYHNGIDKAWSWINGRLASLEEVETGMAAEPTLIGDKLLLGGSSAGLPFNGNLVAAALDNNGSLTIDQAYQKYKAAFIKFGGSPRKCFGLWILGQSNALADYNHPDPVTFGAEEAYAFGPLTAGYAGNLVRGGFAAGGHGIGKASPGMWFAEEWKRITNQTPIITNFSFSGQSLAPYSGGSSGTRYFAPQDEVGTAAGQESAFVPFGEYFRRVKDTMRYSAEFDIKRNIGFIFQGEADASAFNAGLDMSQEKYVRYAHSWLNALRVRAAIDTFAVVIPGFNGLTESEALANQAGFDVVRSAWLQVISERDDTYSVFPHLDLPEPFAVNSLVVDDDGAWVSGVEKNGTNGSNHYSVKMYKAIGITAARNLASSLREGLLGGQ